MFKVKDTATLLDIWVAARDSISTSTRSILIKRPIAVDGNKSMLRWRNVEDI